MTKFIDQTRSINPNYFMWLDEKVDPTVEMIPSFMQDSNPDNENNSSYILNSNGMRCDEYKENNSIIFAGCEYTMPIHLEVENGWAFKTYLKTKKINDSYISLSYPGASITKIINNIFRYVDNFGNPETIVALMPEIPRETGYWEDSKVFKPKIYRQAYDVPGNEHNTMAIPNNLPLPLMALTYINSIRNLETYCKSNNINLVWTSWDFDTNDMLSFFNFKYYFNSNIYNIFSLQTDMGQSQISDMFIEKIK
jgi:hypothetical protein